jgi:hypothetical protein
MSLGIDRLGTQTRHYPKLNAGYGSRFGQQHVRQRSDYAAHIDEHRQFALEESSEFDVRDRRWRFSPNNLIRVVIANPGL